MRRWVVPIACLMLLSCKKHKEEIEAAPDGAAGKTVAARDDAAVSSMASKPGEKPTADECLQAFRNGTTLMMAKQVEGESPAQRGQMKLMMKEHLKQIEQKSVDACIKSAPRDEVVCTITAKTLAEVAHCQGQELSDAGVGPGAGGPAATEKDCQGLSVFIGHILDTDPQVKKIPPEQLAGLRDSLSDIDKRCPGMPLEVLHCMQKSTALAQLVVCANPNTPPPGPPTP